MRRYLIAAIVIGIVVIGAGWVLLSRKPAQQAPATAVYEPPPALSTATGTSTVDAMPSSTPTSPRLTPGIAFPPPTPRPFLADEVLQSQASIAFNAPEQISLGERRVIQLLLDPRQTIPDLLGQQITEPGFVETARIKIAESVEARLSGDAFAIRPVTPEVQALSAESLTEWKWEVQARESGTHRLFLTINAILESSGTKRAIRTFERQIVVIVPPTAAEQMLARSRRWLPWVALAALIALLVSAIGRRKKPLPASHDLPTMRLNEESSGHVEPGQIIAGRYEIERPLGRGGMGMVYAARDREFQGERIALKTILPHLAAGPHAVERFRREIQIARKVSHPNVCRIFDVGRDGAMTFVTMELVEGITLGEHIRRHGPMREDEAVPIIRQIAAGLEETHRLGFVHRDVKSGNIMMAREGRAVLMDFGLACLTTGATLAESLTQTGAVVGSPMYMAPEQFQDGTMSAATDLYALGTVLYEMLTAALPFESDTPVGLIAKRLSEPPIPPSRRLPTISRGVEAVILKCLERDPARRFQRASDVVRSLESAAARA